MIPFVKFEKRQWFLGQPEDAEVRQYANIFGADDPIHLDHERARAAGFSGRIVQGFLVYILAYTVLAREMDFGSKPSNLELRMKFIRPVYLGKAIYLRSLRAEPDAAGLPLVVETEDRMCASGRLLWGS